MLKKEFFLKLFCLVCQTHNLSKSNQNKNSPHHSRQVSKLLLIMKFQVSVNIRESNYEEQIQHQL